MHLRVYVSFKGDPVIYVADLLLNVLPIVLGEFWFCLCFVMYYFVATLVL